MPGRGGARRGEPVSDLPARARPPLSSDRQSEGRAAPLLPRRRRTVTALGWAWSLVLAAQVAGLVALNALDRPESAQQSLAAALGVVLAVGLARRSGGRVASALVLAALIGGAAVATQRPLLLAGAAVGTAVLAGCLAVLLTRPAPSFGAVFREVVIALLIASAGGIGAAGFAVRVDSERFVYTVLGLTLVSTTALVYRLGGGLHSLGRRGLVLAAGALALLVVVVVYTAALTRYGAPELVAEVSRARNWTRENLGGVPHPVEVLIGIPALAWGVSMRSRRRQGWWACAFGTAATAHLASDLIHSDDLSLSRGLAAVYSILLGLVLAFVLIRLERVLTGRTGRPADDDPGIAPREEPVRWQPLH